MCDKEPQRAAQVIGVCIFPAQDFDFKCSNCTLPLAQLHNQALTCVAILPSVQWVRTTVTADENNRLHAQIFLDNLLVAENPKYVQRGKERGEEKKF